MSICVDFVTKQLVKIVFEFSGRYRRNRPCSVEVNLYDCDDMRVIQTCWEVILSFMGDEMEEKVLILPLFQKIMRSWPLYLSRAVTNW